MRYDYASMGFYTFDCLGWPVTAIPPGGGTFFIDELTLAVSGAAGTAVIAAAKMGLNCLAVGGVGDDMMGAWVLDRVASFGVDTTNLRRIEGARTSSSIVTTRPDGSRPALHMKGATGDFTVEPEAFDRVTDATVFHLGGIGLMDRMDGTPNGALICHARERGCVTTVDVFASSPEDMPDIEAVLPFTDFFLPSIDEARALTGLHDIDDCARFFLDRGVRTCVFTLGEHGAYYRDRDNATFHVPAFDVPVKCTCGCGDAFNAGFAVGLCRGMDPETVVRFAQATSALNATGLGSQAGVESFDHTWAFMNRTGTRPRRLTSVR